MKIYISGQISGLSKEQYVLNFNKATMNLLNYFDNMSDALLNIVNPVGLTPFFGIKKWLFYMISDLWQLRKCTHIAMQSNCIESRGAIVEYFFAKFIYKLKILWL